MASSSTISTAYLLAVSAQLGFQTVPFMSFNTTQKGWCQHTGLHSHRCQGERVDSLVMPKHKSLIRKIVNYNCWQTVWEKKSWDLRKMCEVKTQRRQRNECSPNCLELKSNTKSEQNEEHTAEPWSKIISIMHPFIILNNWSCHSKVTLLCKATTSNQYPSRPDWCWTCHGQINRVSSVNE